MTTIQGPHGPRPQGPLPANDAPQTTRTGQTVSSVIPDLPPPRLADEQHLGIQPSLPPPGAPIDTSQMQDLLQRLQGHSPGKTLETLRSIIANEMASPGLAQIASALEHIQGVLQSGDIPPGVAWLAGIQPIARPDEGPLFNAALLTVGLEQLGLGETLQDLGKTLTPLFQGAGMDEDTARGWARLHAAVTLVSGVHALTLAATLSGKPLDDPDLAAILSLPGVAPPQGEQGDLDRVMDGLASELAGLERAVAEILDSSVGSPLPRGRLPI